MNSCTSPGRFRNPLADSSNLIHNYEESTRGIGQFKIRTFSRIICGILKVFFYVKFSIVIVLKWSDISKLWPAKSYIKIFYFRLYRNLDTSLLGIKKNFRRDVGRRSIWSARLTTKGQLISEWLFGVFNFPKNQRKNLIIFWPRI